MNLFESHEQLLSWIIEHRQEFFETCCDAEGNVTRQFEVEELSNLDTIIDAAQQAREKTKAAIPEITPMIIILTTFYHDKNATKIAKQLVNLVDAVSGGPIND